MSMDIFGGKRLKLGVWGLGRGMAFLNSARALNIDVVAGCDFHEDRHKAFHEICPDAALTKDEDEFLAMDFDAVLVSTYCPNHARDTIKALKAGKHVLSEVTAFFTPAQGVALVEAVEESGLVYNLAENYPFSKENMYVTKLYKEGLFGELTYAEYDYVHGGSNPCAFYPDGSPVQPGNQLHHWRGFLNYHYYCTHSLGPVMVATGLRPEKVTAFPEDVLNIGCVHGKGRKVDGIMPNLGAFCPSLIQMSNGSIVRNLMGGTTADSRMRRFFGTKASTFIHDGVMTLKLGADGSALTLEMAPQWEGMGKEADEAGHGGGDFWELYYFARQVLTGEKAPWDVYSACDVTLAGIMAYRSGQKGGEPMTIPDFRKPEVREQYRNDNEAMQRPFDPKKIFPEGHDTTKTSHFNRLMVKIQENSVILRKAMDGASVYPQIRETAVQLEVIKMLEKALSILPELYADYASAKELLALYPDSLAARALSGIITLAEPEVTVSQTELEQKIKETMSSLLR